MNKLFLCGILLLCAAVSLAQPVNYNKQWVQGVVVTYKTTFDIPNPVNEIWDTTNSPDLRRDHSNICDASGNLLFACSDRQAFTKNGDIMDGGGALLWPDAASQFPTGVGVRNSIILPVGDSLYYIFNGSCTLASFNSHPWLNLLLYHVVDMKLNNWEGKMTKTRQIAADSARLSQAHMTAVRHGNGRD